MKTAAKNSWIIALILSVAVNGLLAGVILSKKTAQQPQLGMASPQMKQGPNAHNKAFDNPRTLIARLPEARRKAILKSAGKHLRENPQTHPRELFKALRMARQDTRRIIRADVLDTSALSASLANTRQINDALAARRNALVLEIFSQMSAEERKDSVKHRRKEKHKRKSKTHE